MFHARCCCLRAARQSVGVAVHGQRGSRCVRPACRCVGAAVSSDCVRVVMARGRRAVLSLLALSLTLLLALHLGYVFDSDEQVVRRGVPLPADAAAMIRTLAALLSALDRHHVGYFVGYGSLLGAYRHHGPIPWDDDMDIVCNASDRAAVRRAAASLAPEYEVQVRAITGHRMVIYRLRRAHWLTYITCSKSRHLSI